jgi:YesN/AraC family two-component response regulator
MSANAFAEDIKEAKACGMNDYITKPVDPVRLYETLARIFKIKWTKQKKISQALVFIILFGIVSLFSDMTHEGASSIRGSLSFFIGRICGDDWLYFRPW